MSKWEVFHNRHKKQTEVRYDGHVFGYYSDELTVEGVAEWWHAFMQNERFPLPVAVSSPLERPDQYPDVPS